MRRVQHLVSASLGRLPPASSSRRTTKENVIERCVRALQDQQDRLRFQIIVSANGCTDRTAEVAAGLGVTVVDREAPGKAGALNAGDRDQWVSTLLPGRRHRCTGWRDSQPGGSVASCPQLKAVVPRRRSSIPTPDRGSFDPILRSTNAYPSFDPDCSDVV